MICDTQKDQKKSPFLSVPRVGKILKGLEGSSSLGTVLTLSPHGAVPDQGCNSSSSGIRLDTIVSKSRYRTAGSGGDGQGGECKPD